MMLVIGVVVVGIVMGFDGSGSVHFGKSYPANIERETLIAKLKIVAMSAIESLNSLQITQQGAPLAVSRRGCD